MRRARRTKRAGALVDVQDASVTMDQAQLLAPVSLTVEPGEVVALRGPNGAGKTTLLRCVTGELSPSGGTVHVRGRVPDGRRSGFRRTVAALTSSVPLARDMTVEEACLFVAVTWTADQDEAQSIADRALAELGIARLSHRFPHELSSGQRQLAELATVLSRPFDLLVLDEPEQRLDGDRIARVARILAALRERGTGVVMAAHSEDLTTAAGARVVYVAAA